MGKVPDYGSHIIDKTEMKYRYWNQVALVLLIRLIALLHLNVFADLWPHQNWPTACKKIGLSRISRPPDLMPVHIHGLTEQRGKTVAKVSMPCISRAE